MTVVPRAAGDACLFLPFVRGLKQINRRYRFAWVISSAWRGAVAGSRWLYIGHHRFVLFFLSLLVGVGVVSQSQSVNKWCGGRSCTCSSVFFPPAWCCSSPASRKLGRRRVSRATLKLASGQAAHYPCKARAKRFVANINRPLCTRLYSCGRFMLMLPPRLCATPPDWCGLSLHPSTAGAFERDL